jgi:urea transport system permease protein
MMRIVLALMFCALQAMPAWAGIDPATLKQLAADDSDAKIAAIRALGTSGDPAALPVLDALANDALFILPDGRMFTMPDDKAIDALNGKEIDPVPENYDSITINNRVRGELNNAVAGLRLESPDRSVRLAAAKELQSNVGADMAPALEQVMGRESDVEIKHLLTLSLAQARLAGTDQSLRLKAVETLAGDASQSVRGLLMTLTDPTNEADPTVRAAAQAAVKRIDARLAVGDKLGQLFTGISLASILLLAALGLAITYGVMGVINMAHGELLMVGAYATYVVQGLFGRYLPAYQDGYVIAAIPVAFLAAAAVGMVLERTVIRWLYGRPLETLLATWGLSLSLIQAARVLFGAQNVEVANPSWMSGGVHIMAGLTLPWNRIAIVGFSLFVLLLVWLIMSRTRLGMFVRAVTQNRAMAGCVGVPTSRIDTLAFGLGAGIAGLGGVALSQIANVGPDMGQGYIVDSFMVVVLGGVGQLAGAAWAALGLGIATKFLEGWAGAVIAKIVVLAIIIVFIQKRPQGLFALKGRSTEN